MNEKVELITYGKVYIIVVDGDAKFRRSADGSWGVAESGWAIHPVPLLDGTSDKSWEGWEFISPDGERLDHVFSLDEDGSGFICPITETRILS